MINAIFYPIFIRSNGTREMSDQDLACFLLVFMVSGVFMLIGSLIYSMIKAKTSTYWGFNWHDIKSIWSDTFFFAIGLSLIIVPIIIAFFYLIFNYVHQILF